MNPGQQKQYELMLEYSPSSARRYAQFVSREGYLEKATDQRLYRRQHSKNRRNPHETN
jgi:hypothetical protein